MSDAEKLLSCSSKRTAPVLCRAICAKLQAWLQQKIAGAMAARYIGVAAYAITIDEENGNMTNPRLLVSQGQISDLIPD